jgi:hypothetical protein
MISSREMYHLAREKKSERQSIHTIGHTVVIKLITYLEFNTTNHKLQFIYQLYINNSNMKYPETGDYTATNLYKPNPVVNDLKGTS